MNWSKVLTESSVANYLPLDEKDQGSEALAEAVYKLLATHIPEGYKWEVCWCDGNEASPEAFNQVAQALIDTTEIVPFYVELVTGEYIRGSVGYTRTIGANDWAQWIRWGVGSPMDAGCDEILVPVFQG